MKFNSDGTYYIKYSNGIIEQGGIVSYPNGGTRATLITLPIKYTNINYNISATNRGNTEYWIESAEFLIHSITLNNFKVQAERGNKIYWRTLGT